VGFYDKGVNGKMESDPEFAKAELEVRHLERQLNTLKPEVDLLESRVKNLTESGSYAGRAQLELDQKRTRLSDVRTKLEEAWANRDALLDSK